MISKLKGIIAEVEGNLLLLETSGGVFYSLFCMPDLISAHKIGDNVEMYTYSQVREDALTLFGFSNKDAHKLFQMLLSVDGVGPKLGFAIVSFTDASKVTEAVIAQNVGFFGAIPGVGKKTAQKILLELSSKLNQEFTLKNQVLTGDEVTIVDALTALGFNKHEAKKILSQLDSSTSIEQRITLAIQLLTNKK